MQIRLYPSAGRFVDVSGNHEFIDCRDLDLKLYSNGFIHLSFLKTLIPSQASIEKAYLYLHVIDIGGVISDDYQFIINAYAANAPMSSSYNAEEMRELRGDYIGSVSFDGSEVIDKKIKIDITSYVNDYIYGNNDDYGIILEPKVKDFPAFSMGEVVYDEDNNRAFFMGGVGFFILPEAQVSDYNMEVYVFDLDKNTLERLETKNVPEGRAQMCAALYGDYIYMYGGRKYYPSSTYYYELWRLNLSNNTWESLEVDDANGSPSVVIDGEMVINEDGMLYVVYGKDADGNSLNEIWAIDLTQHTLMWRLTNPIALDAAYVRPASSRITIAHDDRAGHEYDYYMLGGHLASVDKRINKIVLNGYTPVWEYAIHKSSDEMVGGAGAAACYDGYIYYFIGRTIETTTALNYRENILYKINADTFDVERLDIGGQQIEKRDYMNVFIHDGKFYVVNGYIPATRPLASELGEYQISNIWYVDLNQENKQWVRVYTKDSVYNNTNTICIAPMTSRSYRGERQCPFIDVEYVYDTNYDVKSVKISPIVDRDTYISYDDRMENYGGDDYVEVQMPNVEDGVEKRGLFHLDISSLPDNVDILSALLYIPRASISEKNGIETPLALITEDWEESEATWVNRDGDKIWNYMGGSFEDTYSSYNLIVGDDMCRYDVTRLLQQMTASFGQPLENYYGVFVYNQNVTFSSREHDNSSYLLITYIDKSAKAVSDVVVLSPDNDSTVGSSIVFKFKVPNGTNGEKLNFRLELSKDISFSDDEIVAFSTADSVSGWYWNVSGDDTNYVSFPSGGILGYTVDVSLVKFEISAVSSILTEGTWFWRIVLT